MHSFCLVATIGLVILTAARAEAEDRPVAVGPYAQVSAGGEGTIGTAKSYAEVGPALRLHIGTDLFSWLSIGGRLGLATHEATVPAPPVGEYMQFYEGAAEARLSLSVGPVAVFAEAALGYGAVSTNLLEKVGILEPGERYSPTLGAGGGLEYQLQNRHYAFGIGGHAIVYTGFENLQTAGVHVHMRYTY